MATLFPGALDSLSNPDREQQLSDAGVPHATQHANINDAIEAIEAKLGIGSANQTPGTTPGVLRRNANGMSQWGLVPASDLVGGGTGNRVLKTTDGALVDWGQVTDADISGPISKAKLGPLAIVDADVAAGAAIAKAKLAPLAIVNADVVGGANIDWLKLRANGFPGTVLYTADGTNVVAQYPWNTFPANTLNGLVLIDRSIAGAKIATDQISATELAPGAVGTSELGDLSVTTPKIADNTISLAKLQDGSVTTVYPMVHGSTNPTIAGGSIAQLADPIINVTMTKAGTLYAWFSGEFADSVGSSGSIVTYYMALIGLTGWQYCAEASTMTVGGGRFNIAGCFAVAVGGPGSWQLSLGVQSNSASIIHLAAGRHMTALSVYH